ncbi:hypothetical protein SEA_BRUTONGASTER_107 [Gordonia phage BrutonGaster]|uniref:Uncharacterized protein n=1 Tax=Gordonia phage BrutonGaster TaxID=2530116 RepID=A0A482JKQ2_9CAUD|nr:hypothetical protein HOV26_gp075 [Gordonia phage BrutonGaster]QBP33322.1 hypothetical protein SEA_BRUTONGASTER_107 [Gordonia phage BrutonGaster]
MSDNSFYDANLDPSAFMSGGIVPMPEGPVEFDYSASFFDDFAYDADRHTQDLLSHIYANEIAGKWTLIPEGHPVEIVSQPDDERGVLNWVVLGDELHKVRIYDDANGNRWAREDSED